MPIDWGALASQLNEKGKGINQKLLLGLIVFGVIVFVAGYYFLRKK